MCHVRRFVHIPTPMGKREHQIERPVVGIGFYDFDFDYDDVFNDRF